MMQGEVCRMYEPDWSLCDGTGYAGDTINTDYIVITAKGDPAYLNRLVPAPLEATDDVVIYHGYFNKTEIKGQVTWNWPFQEWGFGIKARLSQPPHYEGLFLVQLYVDDDLVMAHGREIWGYPKKLAQMVITPNTAQDSEHYDYTVTRRGSRLVEGSVSNLQAIDKADFPLQTGYVILFKQVPSATSPMVRTKELVFVNVEFLTAESSFAGDGAIQIRDGIADQMPFGPLSNLKGYFGRRLFSHHGLSPLVVDALELARPIEVGAAARAAARKAAE